MGYILTMKKSPDTNIRVVVRDRELLKKIAQKEKRTLKGMFSIVVEYYSNRASSLQE